MPGPGAKRAVRHRRQRPERTLRLRCGRPGRARGRRGRPGGRPGRLRRRGYDRAERLGRGRLHLAQAAAALPASGCGPAAGAGPAGRRSQLRPAGTLMPGERRGDRPGDRPGHGLRQALLVLAAGAGVRPGAASAVATRARSRRERMTRSSATSSTISTHRPPTTYRTSEPARSLALARCAAVVDRRCPDWLGRAVAAGRRGSAAALMEAARPTALAASMVPRPVPGALVRPGGRAGGRAPGQRLADLGRGQVREPGPDERGHAGHDAAGRAGGADPRVVVGRDRGGQADAGGGQRHVRVPAAERGEPPVPGDRADRDDPGVGGRMVRQVRTLAVVAGRGHQHHVLAQRVRHRRLLGRAAAGRGRAALAGQAGRARVQRQVDDPGAVVDRVDDAAGDGAGQPPGDGPRRSSAGR